LWNERGRLWRRTRNKKASEVAGCKKLLSRELVLHLVLFLGLLHFCFSHLDGYNVDFILGGIHVNLDRDFMPFMTLQSLGVGDGTQETESVSDPGATVNFQSTQVMSATFDSVTGTVTIVGLGVDNGLPVTFTLVAVDSTLVAPGAVSITLSDGYTASGNLLSGSVTIQ
jgi:hypothetical protein